MAPRSLVPKMRLAGLQRAARYAGESFAYEELSGVERGSERSVSRLWWFAAALAILGLVAIALR